ncbi:hypothetical protein Mgra_00006743 [Meloidogyne graminicola]|uniref:Protein kinase domain-containing protein n=1 Tax=Meloidogyne graminicola TaxID=189291 RepID=A0A8S9ZKR5_9BILA|nr:hypothetical protein Mgra_00006743 [Meloidogyne graminicola]
MLIEQITSKLSSSNIIKEENNNLKENLNNNSIITTTSTTSTNDDDDKYQNNNCKRIIYLFKILLNGLLNFLLFKLFNNNKREEQNTSFSKLILSKKIKNLKENEFKCFELSDLKTIATLGIGGFGRVNLVKHIDRDNQVFALKILNKQHIKNKNQIEHVLNERNILMNCSCDFIIKLYKTFKDSKKVYMLMEYCPGGDLWTVLRSFLRLDEKKAKYYCCAAIEAFEYLHNNLIIYRDLKPENMLLDINGIPKLIDFGFAKQLNSEMDKAWTFCGTTEYVAPEVILGEGQDLAVDIWSLGIFLFEMLTGSPPFVSSEPMLTYGSIIKGVQTLTFPRYISDNARLLIFKLCRKKSTQRIGFDFISFRNHSMRPPIRPKVQNLTDTRNFDRFPSTDDFACGSDDDEWDENF